MDYSVLIDDYLDLILLNNKYDIYISRRSLKYFVESGKKEMLKKHTDEYILNKLYFAIDNVSNTFENYDDFLLKDDGRLIYVKYFKKLREHSLRIVLDKINNRFEICSIHFQKRKIPP